MSDFPDPDEEYELMYSDELELMREVEDKTGTLKLKVILLTYLLLPLFINLLLPQPVFGKILSP